MNTFASEALSGLSPFQLVFLRDPPYLTSLSFPKIDTIPVKHREYYNLLLARAQLANNMLLEWRTKQALEYESKVKKFRNEEMFQDNQMVYLLAPHVQGPSAHNLVEVVFVVFCFVITFAIVPEVSIALVMHLMSRDFWGML